MKYSTGSYDGYRENDIFVTYNKSRATKYVTKFNGMRKKWGAHYRQYEELQYSTMVWIKEEHSKQHFHRWYALRGINKCYWEEIEVR